MMKTILKKRHFKRLTAVLLVLSILLTFGMPFDLQAFAEEEPATGSDIHAMLYYIDPTKKATDGSVDITDNLELVFQRGGVPDPNKTLFKHFTDFADITPSQAVPAAKENRRPWYREDPAANTGPVYASQIRKVNILDRIQPTKMSGWFQGMSKLSFEDFTGLEKIDVSELDNADYLFISCKNLTNVDLTFWQSFPKLRSIGNAFNNCTALTNLDISTWDMPVCYYTAGLFSKCTSIEHLDISGLHLQKAQIIGSMFNGCTKLKSVDLGELTAVGETQLMYMFKNCSSLEEVDLSGWNVQKPGTFREMFYGCTSLRSVDFGSPDNWGTTTKNWTYNGGNDEKAYESMFEGCTSLEKLDLTCVKGALICSSTFKGCTSLQEIDLSYARLGRNNVVPDLTGKENIYEGCDELYKVTFNDMYPANGGTSVPPKATWARLTNADGTPFTGKEVITATDLFLNFKAEYAGTWVAVDKIVLNANGGTPNQQSIDGAKDMELEYDPAEIEEPEKVGYDFINWYSEKEDGQGELLAPGAIAKSYVYYAHWDPHHYTLVLNGNGGTVPEGAEVNGGVISADRTTITYSNISYPEFVEISSGMFTKTTASKLTSWNTRANGLGEAFAATDSVNKLTPTDGDTVTLFACWDELDYVVNFDSQGGTPVNSKYYHRAEKYDTLPIPEKTGYSFLGWYTEAEGGTKITDNMKVNADATLYAHWQENPKVYFHPDPTDPEPENTRPDPVTPEPTDVPRLDGSTEAQIKIYTVGQNLGVLPVPDWGNRTFKGWYKDRTAESDETLAKSSTIVNAETHYYAHWGYKPVFETDGGTYMSYDESNYEIQDSPSYTVSVLPSVQKQYYTLDGWYFIYEEGGAQTERKIEAGDTVDLTKGTIIRAKWTPTTNICTISLDPNGGSVPRSSVQVYAGHKVGDLPTPTRAGYEFLGWFREDATEPETHESTYTGDTTLQAHWASKDVTVHFDPNGGVMVDSPTVTIPTGDTVSSLPGANRNEYSFDGWYLMGNDGQLDLNTRLTTSTPIDSERTYYAKWVNREMNNGVYKYEIQWDTLSDTEVTNTGDYLVFHPTVSGNISAHLHIHFKRVDSTHTVAPGDVAVTVPQYIYYNKNGVGIGVVNITEDSDFAVTAQDDGTYLVTNKKTLSKDFDLEYHYNVDPLNLEGYWEDGVYHPDYFQNNFDASIKVTDSDDPANNVDYTKTFGLEVHTSANITADKIQSSVSLEWNNKWGNTPPADAAEYFYVTWKLRANVSNCSKYYDILWSEDTVHDGTVINTENEGVWARDKSGGSFNATVVTKHRRDAASDGTRWKTVENEAILTVKFNSGKVETRRVAAQASAYIEDGNPGDPPFRKTIPNYSSAEAHRKWPSGQDYILNCYYPEDDLFPYITSYSGKVEPSQVTWNAATGTYSATHRTINISDGAKGDVIYSTSKGADMYKWNSSTNHELGSGDYKFTDLKITLVEYDAVCLDGKWSNPFVHSDVSDYDRVIVRIRTTSNSNLEVCYSGSGSGVHNVSLPDGTYYYEIEHTSDFYNTDIKVEANMFLNFTNKLRSLVAEDVAAGYESLIKNNTTLKITRGNVTQTILSKNDNEYGEAWPSIYQFGRSQSALYAGKDCSTESKVVMHGDTSTEDFPVVIAGWTHTNGDMKKVIQSGVFHDLLPVECSVDKDTVFVKLRTSNLKEFGRTADQYESQKTGALESSYYSVTFEENYENSGRTMMTVRVTAPETAIWDYDNKATGFVVYYKMKTTYSNIHRNGEKLINAVSFTDTTEFQGVPDSRTAITVLDQQSKPYYRSIDGEQTAFATAKTNCKTPSNYTYGISSVVLTDGTTLTGEEVVGLNSHYSYRISYGDNSKTTDLVFYDVIEKRLDGVESDWEGDFVSIDVSPIRAIESAPGTTGNCAPKVRYSTKPKDFFTSQDSFDIDDDSVWQDDPPDDPSLVTAVAVDCRKTTTNEDFVLDKKRNLTFFINMISPDSGVTVGTIARNEAVVKGTNYENGRSMSQNTRTDVTIRFAAPLFDKTAFPESGTAEDPEDVVLNSVLKYNLTVTNPDRFVAITNIVVEDYLDPVLKLSNTVMVKVGDNAPVAVDHAARISSYSTKTVTVDGSPKLKFTATINSLEPEETIEIMIPVTVSAKPQPDGILANKAYITSADAVKYSIPIESGETFHKVTGAKAKVAKIKANGTLLEGAELQILDADKNPIKLYYEGEPVGEGENNDYFTSSNKVRAFDVAPGTYYLHEKKLPAGYETPAADIKFRIDIEGMHYVVNGNTETSVSHIEMVNIPPFQVIYHTNLPTGTDSVFLTVDSPDLVNGKVTAFSEIPHFRGDEFYAFTGWYTAADGGEKVSFDRTYDNTTHLYAHWHQYKVIFHENKPGDVNKVFKTFIPANGELNARDGIDHFYDIPTFASDDYVFAGWYHNDDYTLDVVTATHAADFEHDTYPEKAQGATDPDYHLYARWIEVGTVRKDPSDTKDYDNYYRGFGLAGVQIREPEMTDSNFDNQVTPGGLRFVTSLSENLLGQINSIGKIKNAPAEANTFGVEYGYAVGTEANINTVTDHYNVDKSKYRLMYNGENVNGVNTTGKTLTAENNYSYITNVNCTSRVAPNSGTARSKGVVELDHRNYSGYRLYTLIITYTSAQSAASMDKKIAARSYIRYYDANGKLRVFFNDYENAAGTTYYGGCMCSFNQVLDIASGNVINH